MGFDTTWEALQARGWNDLDLAQLQKAWVLPDFSGRMVQSIEVARAFYRAEFDLYRHGDPEGQKMLSGTFRWVGMSNGWYRQATESDIVPSLLSWLEPKLWKTLWSYQDECRLLHVLQGDLDNARVVVQQRRWSAFPSEAPTLGRTSFWHRCRFVFSDAWGQTAVLMRKPIEFDTEREMVLAAIAIKRYQLRNGVPPPSLAALVPTYLPRLPYDWFDRQPLHYRLNVDGTFTLYSVGEDGRDDGGDPTSQPERGGGNYLWSGRDAVWPMPGSSK